MDMLKLFSNRKLAQLKTTFTRYLFTEIDWHQRLIILLGHRGAGKTTLLLQAMRNSTMQPIYLTLDHLYFEENRLIAAIELLYAEGYRQFYVDEVHRYRHWSADLKNAFDSFSDIYIIATGSSILEITKGQADLSRRAVVYHLPGLSFREYLNLAKGQNFESLSLENILTGHTSLAADIADRTDVLTHFQEYLKTGYYPFFLEGEKSYPQKLMEITNLIIEVDIMSYEDINYSTVHNLKRLVYIISQSVPFKPNVSKLAEALEISRNTVLKMFDLLVRAQLLHVLRPDAHGNSLLQKPDKIYLQNTNLNYVLAGNNPEVGNVRETFFMNQLAVLHTIQTSRFADFLVNNRFTFEVGGPNKTAQQIKGVAPSYLAIDGIKGGQGNRIPLWLFGFLY